MSIYLNSSKSEKSKVFYEASFFKRKMRDSNYTFNSSIINVKNSSLYERKTFNSMIVYKPSFNYVNLKLILPVLSLISLSTSGIKLLTYNCLSANNSSSILIISP